MKEKKDFTAALDARRALLTRAGEELRTVAPDATRSLSKDQEDTLTLMQQCRATGYAAMEYLYQMPYDAFPEDLYGAVYECLMCCGVCMSLAYRESALASTSHELCAESCRQCATSCASFAPDDAILQACAAVCTKTAVACDAMAAAGEAEEKKSAPKVDETRTATETEEKTPAPKVDEKRMPFICPACGYEGDTDELNSAHETVEERAARINAGEQVRSFKREIRSVADSRKVIGYPILFNELSQDLGGFRERILPDAVTFAADIKADFNHSPDYILGRCAAGTLQLTVDGTGVRMVAEAPETTWANDLLVSINRGDIDQGSFAFRVLPGGQSISVDDSGMQIRTLSKILVRRVSVVSDPAYTGTSIEVRSVGSESPATVPAATVPVPFNSNQLRHRRLKLLEAA